MASLKENRDRAKEYTRRLDQLKEGL